MKKKRDRAPRKVLLVATAGLASVTLSGCAFTSGNLVAPPPCDDAGSYECFDGGPDPQESEEDSEDGE